MSEPTFTDPEAWLAHYTTADTAFRWVLPDGNLRMNPYAMMRDPFENQELYFTGGGAVGDTSDLEKRLAAAEHALRSVRDPVRLTSFTQGLPWHGLPDFAQLHNGPWARPRMWEQYADNHAGVCLVFDKEILLSGLPEGVFDWGPVRYTQEGYAGTAGANDFDLTGVTVDSAPAAVVEHVRTYFEDFFFVKQDDWEGEREFRIILGRDSIGAEIDPRTEPLLPNFLPVSHALRYVILGERFPDWQVPAARAAVHERGNVELRRISWDLGQPYPGKVD